MCHCPQSMCTNQNQAEQQKTHAQFIQFEGCEVIPTPPINSGQKNSAATRREYRYYATFETVRMCVPSYMHQLILLSHVGSTILSITYGLDVKPKNDPFIESAEKANETVKKVPYPGAYLVDHFPFLKHVLHGYQGLSSSVMPKNGASSHWTLSTSPSMRSKPRWFVGECKIYFNSVTTPYRLAELRRHHLSSTCSRRQAMRKPMISTPTRIYGMSQQPSIKVSLYVKVIEALYSSFNSFMIMC